MFFLSAIRAFLNLATLTKHCNLQVRSSFFIFVLFMLLMKIHQKTYTEMMASLLSEKNVKILASGTRSGSQTGPKVVVESSEMLLK